MTRKQIGRNKMKVTLGRLKQSEKMILCLSSNFSSYPGKERSVTAVWVWNQESCVICHATDGMEALFLGMMIIWPILSVLCCSFCFL